MYIGDLRPCGALFSLQDYMSAHSLRDREMHAFEEDQRTVVDLLVDQVCVMWMCCLRLCITSFVVFSLRNSLSLSLRLSACTSVRLSVCLSV